MSNRRNKKHSKSIKRRTSPNAPPGTLAPDPDARPTQLRILRYGPSDFEEMNPAAIEQVRACQHRSPVVWVDVEGLGDQKLIEKLGELFSLHWLELEDIVHVHQRAKVEEYANHLYVVMPMMSSVDRFQSEQISLVLCDTGVLTFQEGCPGDAFDPIRQRIRTSTGKIRSQGPDYLVYAIIDAVIDGYFPVLERYGERLDALDDALVESTRSTQLIDELHDIRHDLRQLRRAIWPMREAMATLLRETTPHIQDTTRVYLRDCYDHVVQLIDIVETYRELTADLRDLYMSAVSNRINETMRVLTIISTIFIPLTFIAGIYGMNFDTKVSPWNMPELEWYYGYPVCLAAMAAVTAGMMVMFYRRGWIRWGRNI